jgi:hypothetical protein
MAKKDPEVEFENVTKAKLIDDDGYEEGKSKEREMTANAAVSDTFKGGVLYKGKAKDYTSASDIINKKKAKVIPINIGPGKKKE